MNLKDFFASKDNPPELFWSLVIEPDWVQAGAWYIKDGQADVISLSPPTPWEGDGELLSAVDAALSASAQKFPEEYPDPQKTVFGVGSSWIKDGEIGQEYLDKIKRICEELSLTPTGFVVLPEAIAHLYKSEEGSPMNAIILGLGKNSLEISVFNLGNLVGSSKVVRSVSLVDDVIEGLSRFDGASPLPSRIIVFDGRGGELVEAKDLLSGVSWEENQTIKFLHTPKVEILESDKKVWATALAGASEMAGITKISKQEEVKLPQEAVPTENFGFVIGKDIAQNIEQQPAPPADVPQTLPVSLPKVNWFKNINFGGKKFFSLTSILGIFLTVLILFWWFYPKAVVTIYVSPKTFNEVFEISFDEGEIVKEQVSGEKTKSTTGTKLVGERAKGTVSLRNGTDISIDFAAGTTLVSSSNLKFTLDEDVSVAAAIDADNPGVSGAKVTAVDLGAQYNLAKDEVFKIGNYPKADAYAKSTEDFSGGSSREIPAVAKDDQEKLRDELKNELLGNAKRKFSEKTNQNQIFVDSLTLFEVSDESFSHRIGDESDVLKLDLSIDAQGIVTEKQKLASFVKDNLKDKIPDGFVLRDNQIEYLFEFVDADGGKYNFKMTTSVNFLPEVKIDQIVKKIAGRLPEIVEEYLTSIPGFTRAEIRINPHFPGRFGALPRVGKNITIEVVAEK